MAPTRSSSSEGVRGEAGCQPWPRLPRRAGSSGVWAWQLPCADHLAWLGWVEPASPLQLEGPGSGKGGREPKGALSHPGQGSWKCLMQPLAMGSNPKQGWARGQRLPAEGSGKESPICKGVTFTTRCLNCHHSGLGKCAGSNSHSTESCSCSGWPFWDQLPWSSPSRVAPQPQARWTMMDFAQQPKMQCGKLKKGSSQWRPSERGSPPLAPPSSRGPGAFAPPVAWGGGSS